MSKVSSERDRALYDAALELCPTFNLKKISRVMTKFYDEALQSAAISSGQLVILLVLARDGATSYARLSRELSMDSTAVGRAAKALYARGLVSIDPIEGSRRKTVAITEAGTACLEKAVPLWQQATERFLSDFGDAAWSRLRSDLSRASKTIPTA